MGEGEEGCPENEEEPDTGRVRESILGLCQGPVEGAGAVQERGRQPEGEECDQRWPGLLSRTSNVQTIGMGSRRPLPIK